MDKLQVVEALKKKGYHAVIENGSPMIITDDKKFNADKMKIMMSDLSYDCSFGFRIVAPGTIIASEDEEKEHSDSEDSEVSDSSENEEIQVTEEAQENDADVTETAKYDNADITDSENGPAFGNSSDSDAEDYSASDFDDDQNGGDFFHESEDGQMSLF